MDAIRAATVEQLCEADSMTEKAAEAVYQFFRGEDQKQQDVECCGDGAKE